MASEALLIQMHERFDLNVARVFNGTNAIGMLVPTEEQLKSAWLVVGLVVIDCAASDMAWNHNPRYFHTRVASCRVATNRPGDVC